MAAAVVGCQQVLLMLHPTTPQYPGLTYRPSTTDSSSSSSKRCRSGRHQVGLCFLLWDWNE